ncbi:Translation initiation factor IF-2, mitochondrial [Psilocybe cubensis]|uniref:Translation initiation factor IF-2, mitochondrial n=2 Tax=Psilocybe cubensis TaxID=181762 RepID=A0ACB8H905_PSICU|nr:Translation initiation factor IF-2, mitochondrial [Psilocybe cubensis]KAH9484142.1 Translation initiation factor IF-2, mitochondrial [Psilocybe cubensis]
MQPKVSTPKLVVSTNPRQETSRIPSKLLIQKSKPRSRNARRKNVYIPTTLTVATLSKVLKVKLDFLLSKMRQVGMTQEATYDYILTSDYAMLLADELGYNPIVDDEAAFDIHAPPPHPNPSSLPPRPPIVTIMGHVDHGKTTLLDTLRSASVAKGEAGGITQHIGAFSVPVSQNANSVTGSQTITFLDTPGHAAFSAMRARGADVTDIVVLVVAADDGIMPQTREVINLLKREGSHVSLVVAINKVDKPGADVESVKRALMVEGIQLEEFGGDIPSVEVSGLTGHGLPELVETLSAVAEMQDLRAEQDGPVFGHILESNFNKGIGPVATVLVQRGCLKVGARVISGLSQGKVRLMMDSNGKSVKVAIPGMAVTVSGWKTLPKAGDEILEGSEADIKKALANRVTMAEKEALHEDVEAINSSRKLDRDARAAAAAAEAESRHLARDNALTEPETGPKELKLIIKADVSGSSEALEGALDSIGNSIAISKVMSTGVGDITESDVMMAKVANAIIVGFSVSAPRIVQNLAAQNGVQIFTSNIIYRLVEDIRERVISMLPKIIETKVVGEATVLQIFEIQLKSKQMAKVAGCRVTNGNVEKQKYARVVRDGEIVYEGSLDTMRHLKKEITEARKGMECGLSLKDFSDLREGDMIQMYEKIEKPGIL